MKTYKSFIKDHKKYLAGKSIVAPYATEYNLNNCEFEGVDFSGANFLSAHLENVTFNTCNLSRATFRKSYIAHCDFSYSNLDNSSFHLSHTRHSEFYFISAQYACLNFDRATNCVFYQTNLAQAVFGGKISFCNFFGSNLRNSDLNRTDFEVCDFTGAELVNADAKDANFTNCTLQSALFTGMKPNLECHELIAALLFDKSEMNPERIQIAGMVYFCKGLCWESFMKLDHPQKKWALSVLKEYVSEDTRKSVKRHMGMD